MSRGICRLPWSAVPPTGWPAEDALRWSMVTQDWAAARLKTSREAYGQFLAFCAAHTKRPDRAAIEAFGTIVCATLKPASAFKSMRGLAYALWALHPDENWAWLRQDNAVLLRRAREKTGPRGGKPPEPTFRVPRHKWPAEHQARWQAAFTATAANQPGQTLRERFEHRRAARGTPSVTPASSSADKSSRKRPRKKPWEWADATRAAAEKGWGCWLHWVDTQDASVSYDVVTVDRLGAYIDWCAERGCNMHSLYTYANNLKLALRVLYPAHTDKDLVEFIGDLKSLADSVPVDKPDISLLAVAELGIALCAEARERTMTVPDALKFRDGFLMLFLCWRPKRISNVLGLSLSQSFTFGADGAPEDIAFGKTKNGDQSRAAFPKALVTLYQYYVRRVRPLLAAAEQNAFWITEQGQPLTARAARRITRRWTEERLGLAIPPHLLRSLFATTLMQEGDGMLDVISSMLDHRDKRTRQHYMIIQPTAWASRRLNAVTDAIRNQAIAKKRSRRMSVRTRVHYRDSVVETGRDPANHLG